MNKIEKIILEETQDLSRSALNEVLDFIQFIKSKKNKNIQFNTNLDQDLNLLNDNELIHLEKEFKNYKELYPRE